MLFTAKTSLHEIPWIPVRSHSITHYTVAQNMQLHPSVHTFKKISAHLNIT